MTHQEILTTAIERAIANGWTKHKGMGIQGIRKTPTQRYIKMTVNDDGIVSGEELTIEEVIYSHDFAKALWGEGFHSLPDKLGGCEYCGEQLKVHITDYCWQYHLQQMVIAPDPIEYLGNNLPIET